MTVRTRVAPSPTGDPHVGTAYIALFNYCFAKKNGGQFILRIEDTDQVRSTRQSEEKILAALKWSGLTWDEGPDVGGPHGPYRQSERAELYTEHAQKLIDNGSAFRCFCTREDLAEMRRQQRESGSNVTGYDGRCARIDAAEADRRAEAGEEHVVRLLVPREGACVVDDLLRDPIEIAWDQVDMQVLLKSDGLPTYHLANVVDDHHMQISHVLRGEEWINSAPKHLLMYEAFGWEPPVLCHLPLLRNPDKSKLSKRKNPTSILYYARMGFLPEALLNYLGMMAWTMPNGEEKFSLKEMAENFDIERVSLGGPVFDVPKLSWLNGRYIREDLDDDQFAARMQAWAINSDYMRSIVPLVRERVERLSDAVGLAGHFFAGQMDMKPEDLVQNQLDQNATLEALQFTAWRLDALDDWSREGVESALKETAEALDLKLRIYLRPLFVAMSGQTTSTPLFDSLAVLGPDMTRARVRGAITVLGGLGNKKLKKLRSAYDRKFPS